MAQLTKVIVDAISLVKKGANGEPIQIYKSAEGLDPTPETVIPESVIKEDVSESVAESVAEEDVIDEKTQTVLQKVFNTLSSAFKPKPVAKASDIDTSVDYASFTSRMTNPSYQVSEAMYTLQSTMYDIFWDDSIKDGKGQILKNIDDFKDYVSKVLEGNRDSQSIFFEKGATDMLTKEDIVSAINEQMAPLNKSLADLTTKVDSMQKTETPVVETPVVPAVETPAATPIEVAKSADVDITAIIKAAVTETLAPVSKSIANLGERIDTIENMRGLSKGAEVGAVTKPVAKATDFTDWSDFDLPGIPN